MEDCVVRRLASGPPLAPVSITVEQARSGVHDAELVVLEGQLAERSTRHGDDLFVMHSESRVFEAQMERANSGDSVANLRLGSRLRLTGICSVFDDPSGRPPSFRLYLRSPDDIVVLETPSRWTAKHTVAAHAGMGVFVLASVGWGVALRRRVAAQTGIIRQRLEND